MPETLTCDACGGTFAPLLFPNSWIYVGRYKRSPACSDPCLQAVMAAEARESLRRLDLPLRRGTVRSSEVGADV